MGVKQSLLLESSDSTSLPIEIPFDFINKESIPKGKTTGESIIITPITVRTWFKLKPLIIQIEKQDLDLLTVVNGKKFDSTVFEIMNKYDSLLFEIVYTGIHNKKGDMPGWFREVLKDNCTFEDLYILLNAILFRIGCSPFSNSITALKNVSPLGEEEIIALQKNKEKWNRKAASCS